MKFVALDVGTKRIGVAKADSNVRIAIPSGTIEVDGDELNQIISFARVYGTNLFIIGLPRNSKGEETAQSVYARNFAKSLKKSMPEAKICFQDESLTSVEAEERLKSRKKKYRKGDIDAEAATIILQDFLETHISKKPESSVNKVEPSHEKKISQSKKMTKHHPIRNFFLSLVALLLVAGAGGYIYYRIGLLPATIDLNCNSEQEDLPAECTKTAFVINSGDGPSQVAQNLKNAGLIRDQLVFRVQYKLFYSDKNLQAGSYDLDKSMDLDTILQKFTSGEADNVFSLTVVPGDTLADVKAKLMRQGYEASEIDAAFHASYNHPVLEGKPADASIEGYLFGDTYEFFKNEKLETIIKTMLDALYKKVQDNNLIAAYEARDLSLYQGITLASIVQKEAENEDMPMVARVFYNRMAADMNLGSDVTAIYAVDLVDPNREIYIENQAVLSIDSPYNTRLYAGLPYGPIDSPGLDALLAVANPAENDYLFFLTGDDNVVYYSDTESGHQQNIIDHCQELCKISL